jgi:citrate lyase subunit beta/citryl-CoA lyase
MFSAMPVGHATWLYVPGHRQPLLSRAAERGADAVIADLEDAVPLAARQVAREHVAGWLDGDAPAARWVRVGAHQLAEDLAAVVRPGLDGIVLAKADLDRVDGLAGHLVAAERDRGMPVTPVIALLETADGILDARPIAGHPRVVGLAIGEADLAAELRITPSADDRELLAIRSQVVLAASAARLPAPIGPVCTEYQDLNRLAAVSQMVVAQGFGALAAIHPAQLPALRDALRPDPIHVDRAQAVLAAVEAAQGGAAVGPDGRMVDEAVARSAREVLDRARRHR